jgi:hypothetical protein
MIRTKPSFFKPLRCILGSSALLAALATGALASGCTIAGTLGDFQANGIQKAAFDMHCDKEKLEVTDLGGQSVGVRGCGHQGRYQFVPYTGWVLNSGDDPKEKM